MPNYDKSIYIVCHQRTDGYLQFDQKRSDLDLLILCDRRRSSLCPFLSLSFVGIQIDHHHRHRPLTTTRSTRSRSKTFADLWFGLSSASTGYRPPLLWKRSLLLNGTKRSGQLVGSDLAGPVSRGSCAGQGKDCQKERD